MIHNWDLRASLGLKMIPHSRTDKGETQAKLSSALLQWLLKCFLRWMAGGRMLREKRISAVKQSSSWMGFFFKAVPPKSSRGFHILPHRCLLTEWLPHLLAKKRNLQIETRADFRQQGLRWRCRVFVYLPALCFYCHCNRAWGLHWKLISGYTFWNTWRCGKTECDLSIFPPGWFGTGDSRQGHGKMSHAVIRELLLYVNLNLPFHCPPSSAQCVIHFLPVSTYKTAHNCFGCIIFLCV